MASLFQIIGGIGLFLYGIKLMSDALQDLAGDRLRQLIAALTSSPLRGAIVGTLVTMIIQSSSATTVMVVSFVQAGLMTLNQALGVIMGANIGTTVTAQLIAFSIEEYALPVIGIGMVLAVFGRTKFQRYLGNGLFGFGLLFLGMETMEQSMSFLRGRQDIFLAFAHNPVLGVLAGTGLTMIVQSSSATVGLTIALAAQGLIPIDAAIPILLGDNLGTTITAVIASLGANRAAKQAAAGHVLFNLLGICIFLPLLPLYVHVVTQTSGEVARQIANAHTIFNSVNTLIFLPFTGLLARLIQKILPVQVSKTLYAGPLYLDEKLIEASPAAAVNAVRQEVVRMGNIAVNMLDLVGKAFLEKDSNAVEQLDKAEKTLNELTHRVASYAAALWHRHISPDMSGLLASYVNGASDIERVGDHCTNMMEMYNDLIEHRLKFTGQGQAEFEDMLTTVRRAVQSAVQSVETEDLSLSREVAGPLEAEIDEKEKILRKSHIQRLNEGLCAPSSGIIFIDLLSNMERIGDHAHNLALIVEDVARLHKKD